MICGKIQALQPAVHKCGIPHAVFLVLDLPIRAKHDGSTMSSPARPGTLGYLSGWPRNFGYLPGQTSLGKSWITGVPKSGDPKILFGWKWQKKHFQSHNKKSIPSDCSPDSL